MKEWNRDSQYNSFNSYKCLVWREQLEACVSGKLMPPVIVDLDLSRRCPLNCKFCNAFNVIDNKSVDLPTEHWLNVSDFLKKWGCKSNCIAGGGESLSHEGFLQIIERNYINGIENGIITSGVPMTDEYIQPMGDFSRWVGFSLDAGTAETYVKLKGITNKNVFTKVCNSIYELSQYVNKNKTECDVAVKFLIHPDNAHEIYESAKLAKELGVRDFQARPVGLDNVPKTHGLTNDIFKDMVDLINSELEKALTLEDENFHVYGVRHKFNPDFTRKVNFKKCRAISLSSTFGADGRVHICFDMRGNESLILCNHYPNPHEILKHWGSERHLKMLDNIDPNECPRCTYGPYNEIVEKVIIKDGFCKNFP